ncbi:MAG: GspH/FimT family pseudopilin [Pseudomonadota bacterium]|nr:GspH/FimT family pseudopilin [Pseudomonadota bacterium]
MRARRLRPFASPAAARGFTLVELLTVVSILIVVLGTSAPSFSDFIAGQQAKGLSFDLIGDLMLARNEALKRNAAVSVSRIGGDWTQGWRVLSVSDGESLSTRNPISRPASITLTGAPAAITFDVNGRVSSPTATVRITIGSRASSRCVQLDPSGRARSLAGACG